MEIRLECHWYTDKKASLILGKQFWLCVIGNGVFIQDRVLVWQYVLFFFLGGACHMACRISVPQPGMEPRPLAVKVQSPNHWFTRAFAGQPFLKIKIFTNWQMSTAQFCYLFRCRGRTEKPKGLILIAVLSTLSPPFFSWPNHLSAFYYPHFTEEETGSEILVYFQGTHSWYLAESGFEFISNKCFLNTTLYFKKQWQWECKEETRQAKHFWGEYPENNS